MSDKTKERILNAIIAVGMVSIVTLCPGTFLLYFIFPDTIGTIMYIALFTGFAMGFLLMILLPLFGGMKPKPVKAEVFASPYASYEEFSRFLSGALGENGYSPVKTAVPEPESTVTVYADTLQGGEWNCVSVLRVPELTEEWTEAANDAITDILTDESGQATIYAYVNMISIFCVDRITPAFRSLVNSNMEQGFKNGRLVVGVSFGGKRIYVARQVGGMFIVKYKKLRRELARILELQEIKS